MDKVRFGVLGTAKIGVEKVIPAMQQGRRCTVTGIASRSEKRAQEAAGRLGIASAYGSYEELLADPEIDAVYIPLPNHLHVPWTLKALEAGKHVLCEKPIALSARQARELADAAAGYADLKVMEAFMYRFHPQWVRAKALAEEGAVGEIRTIRSVFSYYNDDPDNIRNKPGMGGGGLMDIGCYCISLARFIYGAEPDRVAGVVEMDPRFGVDRMASGILDFGEGPHGRKTSTFTCSTQLTPAQGVTIYGTEGRIEIEIPFNAPPDRPTRLWLYTGDDREEITFDICDQYTIQGDRFSEAVLEDAEVPTPLSDAVHNMKAIDAVFRSAESDEWIAL